ncbi:LuxR C-terminal-related transcriptional regulator [Kosakonia sp. S42]|uniref:LuxR C-terminal-related transcriptional regulator n=1 Tax=Kosakonia sp. S42 TaxID=2767458 RepID=UPI00190DC9B0|nr:LuxR C-terminal-related transcriptional regulator [Kosakonia sp. S42]MBK0019000.1 helix-turn-helix transcriptional regulator [Kosakonia sp. S42]
MKIKINILLSKICCSYTKSGMISLVERIGNDNAIKIEVDFKAPFETKRSILVITKGHFVPFTLVDTPFIVISDKVSVDVLLDILINLAGGKLSEYIRIIRLGRREGSIVKEMIFERTDSEISSLLKINKKTISSYKDNIKKKISAYSRIDVFYAFNVFFTEENLCKA